MLKSYDHCLKMTCNYLKKCTDAYLTKPNTSTFSNDILLKICRLTVLMAKVIKDYKIHVEIQGILKNAQRLMDQIHATYLVSSVDASTIVELDDFIKRIKSISHSMKDYITHDDLGMGLID